MTDKMQNEIRAADITRPTDHLEMDGKTYPLTFDLECMRVAEEVYELQYGRNLNFAIIVLHLAAGKLGAVMAVLYGALLSGARANHTEPMTWAEFAEKFRLTSIPAVKDLLLAKVKEALPKAEGEGEGDSANPQ